MQYPANKTIHAKMVRLLVFMGCVFLTQLPLSALAQPAYIIDNFDSVQSGTDGIGSEPFLVHSERYGWLDLTYDQPDGNRDIAWWEGLSWSWQMVDVSAYNYYLLDVHGGGGGEDFTVEFHYNDYSGQSHKPWVRISDYAEITPTWQTVSIPIEDFRDFIKSRATATALGFRYPTDGPESVAIDNIGLSAYPANFFWTHRDYSTAGDTALFVFKPHCPSGVGPCSNVLMRYSINSGVTSDVSMATTSSGWVYSVTGLADNDTVDYSYHYQCVTSGVSGGLQLIHHATIDHVAPSVPSGLSGNAVSPTQVDLSWRASTDNVAVTGYRVYRNDVEIDTTTVTNYSSVGLNQDTEYQYYIRACDAFDNWSDPSDTVIVTTPRDTTPPSMPVGFTGEVTSAATVWLSWQPATDDVGVRGYYILRDGVSLAVSLSNSTTVAGIPGSNHAYAVQAYDDADNRSATSSLFYAGMPTDDTPPTVPSNLAAVAVSPAQVDLAWSPATDAGLVEGYEVFMNESCYDTTAGTNYSLHGLRANTEYHFTVRAFDSAGYRSAHSQEAIATTLAGSVAQLGSYASAIPAGYPESSDSRFVTDDLAAPYPTHDWWTSILHVRNSGMVSAKPLAFYTKGWGVECSYPSVHGYSDRIEASFTAELTVSGTGDTFPVKPSGEARVARYGDFCVQTRLGDPDSSLHATLVRGSPYLFVTYSNSQPVLDCPLGYSVLASDTVQGYLVLRSASGPQTTFAIFAPSGTMWDTTSPDQVVPTLPVNQNFLSIAAMTDRSGTLDTTEFALLQDHAYAFVTNTRVDFSYEAGWVTAEYHCDTVAMQGAETNTLMGLSPLHWRNTQDDLVAGMTYQTILGDIKIHAGNTWVMSLPFGGIVPQFPKPTDDGWSDAEFAALAQDINVFNSGISQTYWFGLELGRVARAILALDAAGHTLERDSLVAQLRAGLVDAFTYTPGETDHFFAYESGWGSMVGFAESFNAVSYLNDHHFHFGYYVYAAAVVAMFDPSFADEYRDMVDKVIRDYNNPSRDVSGDDPLPWLRHFDVWEGHCWATGLPVPAGGPSDERLYSGELPSASEWGPDQESTSEAMNSWAAMFLWGLVTRNQEFIDMGAIGYTIEAESLREFWYNADQENWPGAYPKTMICRLFGGKADAYTWFDQTADAIWGIQYVPVGPHMTYMGQFRDYRITDYNYFKANYGTASVRDGWKEGHWMYRSFFEAATVLGDYDSSINIGSDNAQAAVYSHLHAMNTLGTVDTGLYSDCPTVVAFAQDGETNYVAYNRSDGPITASVYRVSDQARVGTVIIHDQRTTHLATGDDEDADGLVNALEMALGTDLYRVDSDGDGQRDPDEVIAGTDAMDPSSLFEIDFAEPVSSTQWRLEWPGSTARTYQVTAYPSIDDMLINSNGTPLVTDLVGTGRMSQVVSPPGWPVSILNVTVETEP